MHLRRATSRGAWLGVALLLLLLGGGCKDSSSTPAAPPPPPSADAPTGSLQKAYNHPSLAASSNINTSNTSKTSQQAGSPDSISRWKVKLGVNTPRKGPKDAEVTIVEFSDFQ